MLRHCDYLPTSPPTSTMNPDLSTQSLVPLPKEPVCPAPLSLHTLGHCGSSQMPGLQATHWEVTSNSSDSRLLEGHTGAPGGAWAKALHPFTLGQASCLKLGRVGMRDP